MTIINSRILFLTPGCFEKGGISRYYRYQINALREIFGDLNVRALSLLGPDPEGFETPYAVTWHGPTARVSKTARVKFALRALWQAVVWPPHRNPLRAYQFHTAGLAAQSPVGRQHCAKRLRTRTLERTD